MERCRKPVFVKILGVKKSCIRIVGHGGRCIPNLIGEKFGSLKIIKKGESFKYRSHTQTTWVAEQEDGFCRTIRAHYLLSNKIRGIQVKGPYSSFIKGKRSPEYDAVYGHYHCIFKSQNPRHRNYKGMPFHDAWNPDKGGSFWKGTRWVIDNLGLKPGREWSLDVIEPEKGFVPGNLRWALRNEQAWNKIHRRLGTWSIKELRVEAFRHGCKMVKR